MAEMSPGQVLRQLQQAQAGLRKAREALRIARSDGPGSAAQELALTVGWESLAHTYRTLAAIPRSAATDAVMTRQLSVSRYATALLVRLRRLVRKEVGAADEDDEGLAEGADDFD
jgi:hypothetical protein